MEFEAVVRRRRMARNFTDEPADPAAIARIFELARHAPSAGFTQGQAFVVVLLPRLMALRLMIGGGCLTATGSVGGRDGAASGVVWVNAHAGFSPPYPSRSARNARTRAANCSGCS
jgi:nitroreductase